MSERDIFTEARQVPASFFIFSRPALVGGAGNLAPDWPSP
jgi:hypothetical protein